MTVTRKWGLNYAEGTLGGSALAVDATAPNTSSPAESRRCRIQRGSDGSYSGAVLTVFAFDGTTITVEAWVYLEDEDFWLDLGTVTATPDAPGQLFYGNLDNAEVFMQITANTLVTRYGWAYG